MDLASLPVTQAMRDEIARWLNQPRYAQDRPALTALVGRAIGGDAGALAELTDAFAGPLPIGTGGRRGAVGPGPNRMNAAVLRETAQGIADAVTAQGAPPRVAVVYDTRRDSRQFARVVADQLAAAGLGVLLIDAPRATPLLSFVVRRHGCGAGVVISASHNPAGDNGIKVYGPDGAQVLGARDKALMDAIQRAMGAELAAGGGGSVEVVQTADALAAIDGPYLRYVEAQGVRPEDLSPTGIAVAFTPLHGVGHTAVVPALESKGVKVHVVEAQLPDGGEFATVKSANPELPESMALAKALAQEVEADLVLATDPDADRLGALARTRSGDLEAIDGNRLGVLMLDHILRHCEPPARGWVLTTVVSSPLVPTLARSRGLEVVDDLLVGFKHHAGMMAEQPERPVVLATEESHGYVRGDDVHDKDGAVAAVLLAEAAAVARKQGRTLFDNLEAVWRAHGYHREKTANLYAHGAVGRDAIAKLIEHWRSEPPEGFGGLAVVQVTDRKKPRSTGSPTRDLLGNVLIYDLAAQDAASGVRCRLVLRPSGTEPKVKVYALVRGPPGQNAEALRATRVAVDGVADAVLADAQGRAETFMAPLMRPA